MITPVAPRPLPRIHRPARPRPAPWPGLFVLLLAASAVAAQPSWERRARDHAPLAPAEVGVVANFSFPYSVDLARYYMKARAIPTTHLLVTGMPREETIERHDYRQYIAEPVLDWLLDEELEHLRCLVLMHGVPLKVREPHGTTGDRQFEYRSAVDSELACLLWPEYPVRGRRVNPLAMRGASRTTGTLMIARLDGPDADTVYRMIDDGLAAQSQGLRGKVYIDARGRTGEGHYARADRDLVRLGAMLRRFGELPVVIDEREELFADGDAPEAAIYVGWYHLSRYIDAFEFVPGAVGYHIASLEAASLRGDKPLWCPELLRDGAAATLGAVDEPYLTAFPSASEFIGLLATGRWTLADAYWLTVPSTSWMMTLIGDPLYRPFAANPQLTPQQLFAELAP